MDVTVSVDPFRVKVNVPTVTEPAPSYAVGDEPESNFKTAMFDVLANQIT